MEELRDICTKHESIERDLENAIPLAQLRVQNSMILEAFPNLDASEETKLLLDNARKAFGTQTIGPQLDLLVSGSRSIEGIHYFIMAKMYLQGLKVEVDCEKSSMFFKFTISYRSRKAYAYLGRQYFWGLGMREDERKAVELYLKGAEQQDPECLYEMGQCFQYGCGVDKNMERQFEYYMKAAKLGHIGGIWEAGYCLELGMGTEINIEQAAKHYMEAAGAATSRFTRNLIKMLRTGTSLTSTKV